MIKRVAFFSLPEGASSEEFWKYWKEVHAADIKRLAGPKLRKYVINRVIGTSDGDVKFWGMAELWYDSTEEEHRKMFSTLEGKETFSDFWNRVKVGGIAYMEELEINLKN